MPTPQSRSSAALLPLHQQVSKSLHAYLVKHLPSGVRAKFPVLIESGEEDLEPPLIIITAADDGVALTGLEPHRLTLDIRLLSTGDQIASDHALAAASLELVLADPEAIITYIHTAQPVAGLHIYFLDADIVRHSRDGELNETIISATIIAQPRVASS